MSRYIDIEPYEKDGWYLQKYYHNSNGEGIKMIPLVSVPTADVAPVRHGRWIKTIGENGVTDAVSCSICGFEDNRYELFNYCPHCGAKMEE